MLVFPPDVNSKSDIENDEYGKHKVILLLQTCIASLTLSVMYVVTTHKIVGRLYMLTCICYVCYCATLLLQTKLRKTKWCSGRSIGKVRSRKLMCLQRSATQKKSSASSEEAFQFSEKASHLRYSCAADTHLEKCLESWHHLYWCVTCSLCRNETLFCLSQKWVNSGNEDLGASPSWWASVSGICC